MVSLNLKGIYSKECQNLTDGTLLGKEGECIQIEDPEEVVCICQRTATQVRLQANNLQKSDEKNQTLLQPQNLIGCDGCENWYHIECVAVSLKKYKEMERDATKKWYCHFCTIYNSHFDTNS